MRDRLLPATLAALAAWPLAASAPVYTVTPSVGGGLASVIFRGEAGDVRVNLPADLRSADPFSFSVVRTPAGEKPRAREKNGSVLAACSAAVEGTAESAGSGRAVAVGETISIALTCTDGGRAATTLPLLPTLPSGEAAVASAMSPAVVREVVPSGRTLVIYGDYDGDATTTAVNVDGHPAPIYAESPRSVVSELPPGSGGDLPLTVREGQRETRDTVRSVSVELSSSQLRLKPGKTAILTARVTGLKELRFPIRLWLENRTPAKLSLEGGPRQVWEIDGDKVAPDGSYTLTRTITGLVEGDFDIGWSIEPARRRGIVLLDLPPALAPPGKSARSLRIDDREPAGGGTTIARGGALRYASEPFRLAPGRHAVQIARNGACLAVAFDVPKDAPDYDYRWLALRLGDDPEAPGRVLLGAPADLDAARLRPLAAATYWTKCAAPGGPPAAGFRCVEHARVFDDAPALARHLAESHPDW